MSQQKYSWMGIAIVAALMAGVAAYGLFLAGSTEEAVNDVGRPSGVIPPRRLPDAASGVPAAPEVLAEAVARQDPLALTVPPLDGFLPEIPLAFSCWNTGDQPLSGKIELLLRDDPHPAFRGAFSDRAPGASARFVANLPDLPVPAGHDWPFIASATLADGRRILMPFSPEFRVAARAARAPRIDGDLADWNDMAPIRLDRAAFVREGPAEGAPAAELRLAWDNRNLYLAATVADADPLQTMPPENILEHDALTLSFSSPALR
jgi:hypothetical protein